MQAHIYSVIIPFIVKNTIRDKYTKNCFSDGVKLRLNLLKECVSKRLGPFLAVCIRQDLFCITLSVVLLLLEMYVAQAACIFYCNMKVVQLAKITFYR